jgi:hypothetical protein
MKTKKTVTINGIKFTAAKLRKLIAENGIEMACGARGDFAITTEAGELAACEYSTGEVGVFNYGAIHRSKKGFGALVAILD